MIQHTGPHDPFTHLPPPPPSPGHRRSIQGSHDSHPGEAHRGHMIPTHSPGHGGNMQLLLGSCPTALPSGQIVVSAVQNIASVFVCVCVCVWGGDESWGGGREGGREGGAECLQVCVPGKRLSLTTLAKFTVIVWVLVDKSSIRTLHHISSTKSLSSNHCRKE